MVDAVTLFNSVLDRFRAAVSLVPPRVIARPVEDGTNMVRPVPELTMDARLMRSPTNLTSPPAELTVVPASVTS